MFVSTFLINTVVQGTLLLVGSYMIESGNLTGEILLASMLYQGQLQVDGVVHLDDNASNNISPCSSSSATYVEQNDESL